MPYYALIYEAADDYVARRTAFREQHLQAACAAHARRELVLAGAFADPVDRALLVFRVDKKGKVEDFARQDPYVVNGLVKKWEVRPWNVVVGNESVMPGELAQNLILRQWSARTSKEQWPRYRAYFSRKVLPDLRAVDGFLDATLFVRHTGEDVEILVETCWRSLDAIRAFAGPNLEAAVVSEEAVAMLTEFDGHARHYEVAVAGRR